MLSLLISLLFSCLIMQLINLCYVVSQAIVGTQMGMTVESVTCGLGPHLFTLPLGRFQCRIKPIPFGGYTKFYSMDHHDEDGLSEEMGDGPIPYEQIPAWKHVPMLLVGPLTSFLAGIGLAYLPIWLEFPALAVTDRGELIRPSSIPDLRITDQPVTLEQQLALFDGVVFEYFRGAHFLPNQGWGGPFSMTLTLAATARQSVPGFLSLCGVLTLGVGVFNLLPLPYHNGGRLTALVLSPLLGLSRKLNDQLGAAGVLYLLALWLTLFISDASWFYRLLRQAL